MNLKKTLAMVVGLTLLVVAVFFAAELYDHRSVLGTASYRERIALPDGCRLIVVLSEEKDGSRIPVASVSRILEGEQVPLPFELLYREKTISEGLIYSLSARIENGTGELLFVTKDPVPMPKDDGPVEIKLRSVR
ncbi:YbaY family lipoprotein [Dethiosulfovibrio sp. F2B]|uniref:YbaY family lipoprotein n=1 Tax=Dethiosulfovibrio faecalis TaxID=2720018 RepID=UPI001F41355A|nr:YbaY family lipoprotein [Dethiosulfovibrio faecalis]MCF4152405.1 YbaY family lipoprotein [Dethiosulfovibrio faecalis]